MSVASRPLAMLTRLAYDRGFRGWLTQPSPLDAAWLAMLVGGLVGLASSPNPSAGLGRFAALIASAVLFSWLVKQVCSTTHFKRASWALVAVCAIGALAVLALIRGQLPDSPLSRRLGPVLGLFAGFPAISGDVLDVNGRFPIHQYGFAYLLLVIAPFLVAEAALGTRPLRRVAALLGALALGLLLAASEARGAMLALVVGVALVARLRSRWFWMLLPLGGLLVYLLLARGLINRSLETQWLQTRLSIWTRSLELLTDYPFGGVGLGMRNFAEVFAWNFGLPGPYQVVHSHNILIQAYAEQGLLGLVGLLLVVGGGLLSAWRAAGAIPAEARPEAAGVLGALSASALYGLTDQVPTTDGGLAILATLCALGVAGARLCPPLTSSPPLPVSASPRPRVSLSQRPHLPASRLLPAVAIAVLLLPLVPRWASGLALNLGAVELAGAVLNQSLGLDQRSAALTRAERSLSAAVAWNHQNTSAYRELARVRLLLHDVPGALAALDQARRQRTLSNYELMQLGRLYFEIGLWREAFDLWTSAGQEALLRRAAGDLTARSDFAAAAAAHAALVELQPNAENLMNLARALLAAEGRVDVDEALRRIEQAAELKPEIRRGVSNQLTIDGSTCRVNEAHGGGRLDECVFWFSLAGRIDPTYDRPLVELGEVFRKRGRYDEAADYFRAAISRDPKNSSSWHELGEAQELGGRFQEALASYDQAVRLTPGRAGLWASLSSINARLGRCEAAQQALSEALRLNPDDARAQSLPVRDGICR
jgi:tetratricopeptide (TPR) repeat protein